MFNKKFEGKYDGIRRPIICNGLREIKPYKVPEVIVKPPYRSEKEKVVVEEEIILPDQNP